MYCIIKRSGSFVVILLYWSSFVFIIVKLRNCVNCRFHVVPCVVYISVVILCTVLATFQPKVVVACYSLNHYVELLEQRDQLELLVDSTFCALRFRPNSHCLPDRDSNGSSAVTVSSAANNC